MWVVEYRGRFHRNAQLGCSWPHPLLTKCLPRLLGFPNVYTVAIVSLPSREMGDASDRRRVHPSHFVFSVGRTPPYWVRERRPPKRLRPRASFRLSAGIQPGVLGSMSFSSNFVLQRIPDCRLDRLALAIGVLSGLAQVCRSDHFRKHAGRPWCRLLIEAIKGGRHVRLGPKES